ncbi:hypothetical protein [Caballeronia sp. INML2]|uniref:hypothetical protein n=1 Tax=Caballeronia sp. INML2 TaxID=2921748 RepID=UPI0020281A1E|nr:hypothetical protein [Caballeronia sp. INML2]
MHKPLPFIERNHGPVGDVRDAVDRYARVAVGPVADFLARAHAVNQGVAAAVRVARAQILRVERDEPDLIHTATQDALLVLAETASNMVAEQAEQISQWIEGTAMAGPYVKSDRSGAVSTEAVDGSE